MEELFCGNCVHFYQHYTLGARGLTRVYCGHCGLYKAKKKRPDTKACEDFSPGVSAESNFATKEYLSKELLRYWTSLELLPKIQAAEEDGVSSR